jgi:hypothetical protein
MHKNNHPRLCQYEDGNEPERLLLSLCLIDYHICLSANAMDYNADTASLM